MPDHTDCPAWPIAASDDFARHSRGPPCDTCCMALPTSSTLIARAMRFWGDRWQHDSNSPLVAQECAEISVGLYAEPWPANKNKKKSTFMEKAATAVVA